MPIIISGIIVPFTQPETVAIERATKMLSGQRIISAQVVKKSIDARREISFVYSVALEIAGDQQAVVKRAGKPNIIWKDNKPLTFLKGTQPLEHPPVIVGFGPAGMFAGLVLARLGFRPIIIERGQSADLRIEAINRFEQTRQLDENSNIQFGEGGAGTFSDGKLVTRIGDERCNYVLEQLVLHGAPAEILVKAKPHVGTDNLRTIVSSIRGEIIKLGGQVHFSTTLTSINIKNGKAYAVNTNNGEIPSNIIILATGHSARDTIQSLHKQGVEMLPKPFSVGVRIEHLQRDVDASLYGKHAGNPLLPKGEYQLSHRTNERGVYTFCMCPGGVVVPATSFAGGVVTNGMSTFARNEDNANSALVVSVGTQDFGTAPMDGVNFQQKLEQTAFNAGGGTYSAPAQTVMRFLNGEAGFAGSKVIPSYSCGVAGADFSKILPPAVTEMLKLGLAKFGGKLRCFGDGEAFLTGVETRTSCPVRILRQEDYQSVSVAGLYPTGEGAGYAGGIVSAAVDAVKVAAQIAEQFCY